MSSSSKLRIGLISDTHGLLRPEALRALAGCDHIVHAGDIGGADVLAALAAIAPVKAVRGNNDEGAWARHIPETEVLQAGDARIYVIHDLAELKIDPAAQGFDAVISGHSHKPKSEVRQGVLYVNPGSAGPRRFTLPVSIAYLDLAGTSVSAQLIELEVAKPARPVATKRRRT